VLDGDLECAALYVATRRTLALVHALKYRGGTRLAEYAGRWIAEAWPDAWPREHAVLVPIPLHGRRARERGFNQSAVLARGCAAVLGLRVSDRELTRTRHTRPQSSLEGDAERRANVRRAFRWRSASDAECVRVVLVDDVATSGATLCEAAHAVRAGGVRRVSALTLLRATGHAAQATCREPRLGDSVRNDG
jgi:ComF family protein